MKLGLSGAARTANSGALLGKDKKPAASDKPQALVQSLPDDRDSSRPSQRILYQRGSGQADLRASVAAATGSISVKAVPWPTVLATRILPL